MKSVVTAVAVAISLVGGVTLLSATTTPEKQVCEAHNGGAEHGCVQFDCATACPNWTELEANCLNNVYSCKGYPPSGN